MILHFESFPKYAEAHPGEVAEDEVCEQCAWAIDPNTGERYLLWRSNGVHWALSRHDHRHGTDVRVEGIRLVGAPEPDLQDAA
jgi:hypothetical protein